MKPELQIAERINNMVNVSKFYIMMMCAAVLMTGCGQTEEPVKETVVTDVIQENEEPVTEEPEVSAEEPEVSVEEPVIHPIVENGIDYLSFDGISLEPSASIAMVAENSENPYWDVVKKGAFQAIEDLNSALGYSGKSKINLSFDAPDDEDVIEQINIIDQFLDKAPDALCVAFSDASACKTQMQMAKNNGIKLLAFDTSDDSRLTETVVGTDNNAAATQAAAKMYEAINYEGKVAILVHNSMTQTGQERKQAIINELAANYNDKNIKFVDIVYLAQEDRTEDEILNELLERNPDLAGIICTDLITTEMVIDYAKKQEEVSFKIVGFDVSEKIVSEVGGLLEGTVAQDPYGIGYATIVAAARSIAGMENAENIYTAHQWIDQKNLESEEVQALLNYSK